MKFFLAALLLPLVASRPDQGTFTSITQHGVTYGHGHGHKHGHGSHTHSHAAPADTLYYDSKPAEPAYAPEPAYKPEPAYHKPAPAYHHHAPAYHQPAPAYHKPHYGHYEQPKHNCTVQDVTEVAQVCTPTIETNCENVELAIKRVVDGEYCYDVARTVCTETIEEIPNEVCSYTYNKKYEDTTAKTAEVSFKKETNTQMVTVCQPGYGHGYHSYGHQYCKEVAQETAYNVPIVTPVDVDVKVGYPEPERVCVNKPISLPRITCEVITEQKCVLQPEVEDDVESVEKCTASIGEPDCQDIELTLPKQVCVELVYGYASEVPEHYVHRARQ